MLESVIKKSGLVPIKTRYFFASLFPVIAAVRLGKKILLDQGALKAQSDLKIYQGWLNRALITVHDTERCIFLNYNKLFGLSIFCLCQKK